MPKCSKCKKPITSTIVTCGDCLDGAHEEKRSPETPQALTNALALLALAVEDIPHRCASCRYRQGWDICQRAAFIDDGDSCGGWEWVHSERVKGLLAQSKKGETGK